MLGRTVLLSCIRYNVTVVEDMVMFSGQPQIFGLFTKLVFTRACGCWYVEIHSTSGRAMMSHIEQAMALVAEWFGGDFQMARGEHKP